MNDFERVKEAISGVLEHKHQKNIIKKLRQELNGKRLDSSISKEEVVRQVDFLIKEEDPGDLSLIETFPNQISNQQKTNLWNIKDIISNTN